MDFRTLEQLLSLEKLAAQARPKIEIPKQRVLEFPLRAPAEPETARCTMRQPDGTLCEMPVADPSDMCARHLRWNNIYPTSLPFPDNALALQEMMGYAVVCTIDKLIDGRQALAIAQLGRAMQKNLARCEREVGFCW